MSIILAPATLDPRCHRSFRIILLFVPYLFILLPFSRLIYILVCLQLHDSNCQRVVPHASALELFKLTRWTSISPTLALSRSIIICQDFRRTARSFPHFLSKVPRIVVPQHPWIAMFALHHYNVMQSQPFKNVTTTRSSTGFRYFDL